MIRILAALEPYGKSAGIRNAQRLRAFVLLLRYSGLRIGDATQLDVNRIQKNKLLLHTEKTGVLVYCVLPDMVVKALDAAPHSSTHYFFWTGKSNWRRYQAAMRTDSVIRSLWSYYSVAFHSIEFPYFSGIAALGLRSATTHLGRARGKSKSRPI
jgi:integrase